MKCSSNKVAMGGVRREFQYMTDSSRQPLRPHPTPVFHSFDNNA